MWENAISAVGNHVAEGLKRNMSIRWAIDLILLSPPGYQVWNAFRSFELRMLEGLEAMGAVQPAADKIV